MKVLAAIPALDELEWIFPTLDSLAEQDYADLEIWVCVNHPESWRDGPATRALCERNVQLLQSLRQYDKIQLKTIDHCTGGRGWSSGKSGVGMARRTLMDAISAECAENDIILSLDADTVVPNDYVAAVAQAFARHPRATGLSAPYMHRLTGDEHLDRAILRYEIYLRYYALSMCRTGSPYNFTAIGSAMACPAWAYRKLGGMVPRQSGEDFYFLQQLQKIGSLVQWLDCRVFPGVRKSSRVPFGTGRAITDGIQDNWAAYPIIACSLYDDVAETVALFPRLYESCVETPMSAFLSNQLKADDPFAPMRANFKHQAGFVRACHERVDGLRIFQYLRTSNALIEGSDEDHLREYLHRYAGDDSFGELVFASSPIGELDRLRLLLMQEEDNVRQYPGH
jgi:hypothetical protein